MNQCHLFKFLRYQNLFLLIIIVPSFSSLAGSRSYSMCLTTILCHAYHQLFLLFGEFKDFIGITLILKNFFAFFSFNRFCTILIFTLLQAKKILRGFLKSTMCILKRLTSLKSVLRRAKQKFVVSGVYQIYSKATYRIKIHLATRKRDLEHASVLHINRNLSISFFRRYSQLFDIFFSSTTPIQTLNVSVVMSLRRVFKI